MGLFDWFRKKNTALDTPVDSDTPAEFDIPDDDWDPGESMSQSLSKDTGSEDMSNLVEKDQNAVDSRKIASASNDEDSISNEEITKGTPIGDIYEVVSDAIRGGMGSVWKVHHKGWNTDLAMKRPQQKYFAEGSEERKKNFIHECESWINLGLHPNIVSCYYVREIGGVPSIFSEWMENGSLHNRIEDGSLYVGTEREVQERLLDIAIQFARGLHYAHESEGHLIHQDVKPDNLLLTRNWDAKVSDFGLARARIQLNDRFAQAPLYNNPGATIISPSGGKTPAYCSPEQASERPLTRRTDIYSWAVSVLEMYLGGKPWSARGKITGPTVSDTFRQYFSTSKIPIPVEFQSLLADCLKKKPEERPSDFGVVESTLKEIYKKTIGCEYPREMPRTALATADSLNNKALSFIDLGMYEEAEELLQKAVDTDGSVFLYQYNYALFQWNRHKYSDVQFVNYLKRYADKSSLCSETMEKLSRLRGGWDEVPRKEEYWYFQNKGRPEDMEPLIPLSKVSYDGRYEIEGYMEWIKYRGDCYGYRVKDLQTGQVRDVPNEYKDYGVSSSRIGSHMHPHFYKSTDVFFAGPRSELIIMQADVLWFFDAKTDNLILSLPPVVDDDGDSWDYFTVGYTPSGIIEYRNAQQLNYITTIHPHPEEKLTYEVAGISTVDARLEAERNMLRYYEQALACWERGDIDGTFQALNQSLEDQVLTRHEPSLRLWTKLAEYYERGSLVTVLPTEDEPTPVPERDACLENQEFKVAEEYKNGTDNGQTILSLHRREEDEYDTCNDMFEYTFYYTLIATDKRSGKNYFEVKYLEVASEADWKRFSKDRYLGLEGDHMLWYLDEYGPTRTIDLAERSRSGGGSVRFMLPGGYELRNTNEGVDIGGFVFKDLFTDFRPLWASDIIGCRDYNYRLVYRYLEKKDTEGK